MDKGFGSPLKEELHSQSHFLRHLELFSVGGHQGNGTVVGHFLCFSVLDLGRVERRGKCLSKDEARGRGRVKNTGEYYAGGVDVRRRERVCPNEAGKTFK